MKNYLSVFMIHYSLNYISLILDEFNVLEIKYLYFWWFIKNDSFGNVCIKDCIYCISLPSPL